MMAAWNRTKTKRAAVLALLFISVVMQVMVPAQSDKGWLLHAAQMMQQGRRLYSDIIEVNPPLVIWLYEFPEWISLHVKWLADFEALHLVGMLFTWLVLWLCAHLLKRHPGFADSRARRMEFTVLLAMIFIFYTPQLYFCDRDYIFLVFTFPYMISLMPSLAERKQSMAVRCLIGCLATIGYLIKPHTIIVFAILQLLLIIRARSLKALINMENIIIAAGAMLYLFCVYQFAPDYLHRILPMAISTYSAFDQKGSGYFYFTPILISAALIFADFRAWHETPYHRDIGYLMWLGLAMTAYALINNGWGYTYNPLYSVLLLSTGWMLWEYDWLRRDYESRDISGHTFVFGMRGCMLSFALPGIYMLIFMSITLGDLEEMRAPCGGQKDCWKNGPYAQFLTDHDLHSFGSISLDFANWVELVRLTGASWDTRFNHLWMLPKLVKQDKELAEKNRWVLDYVGKGYAEDMNGRKPATMFVDTSPGFMGYAPPLDYIAFLSVVPEFKEAWGHYKYATSVDLCTKHTDDVAAGVVPSECRYDIYRRGNSP